MMKESPSTAVVRALTILEAVAQRSGGLTNSEISRRLEIPKSSASYILRTLEQEGYLRRDRHTGKYRLGLKVLNLSHRVLLGLDIRELALPVLRQLVERSHLTAHLAILDHGEAVYIEKVDAPGFIKMDTWVGRRLPIHTTGVGKALVAHLPEAEAKAILKEQGLRKMTSKTITAHSAYLRELEKIRAQGYAVDDEENNLGVRCVAAPVFDSLGRVEAAVGVSGTTSQVDKPSLPKIAELVKEAARGISEQIGYPAAPRKP
ncbi:MAG: IclR family transcriptional regulator [Acidobacteria bacterium]|nr:IclR family transcriptional regulator [Acidobacteriota bacterium]